MNKNWTIQSVIHAGVFYNPETGAPRAAECFKVELASDKEALVADVELTMEAAREIDFKLDAEKEPLPARNRLAHSAVEEFVEYCLERGWNPKGDVRLVLNVDAVGVVIGRMK